MGFAKFMSSAVGRWIRIIAGLALIGYGVYLATAGANIVVGSGLAVVGLVPLVAGAQDFCVFAPLFGAPFAGAKVRSHA